jgi:hypothetical protein
MIDVGELRDANPGFNISRAFLCYMDLFLHLGF